MSDVSTLPGQERLTPAPEESNGAIVRRVQDDSEFAILMDSDRFAHVQRVAKLFASSSMIPQHYQGNIGNCFIALQMALRLGVDPFMFMQNSHVVHGKPGIEAKLAIALINSSGIFIDALDFEINGEDPDNPFDESYKVRAFAVRKATGKRVNGTWIDWKLVKAEGWFEKAGSKWKTMPEQMFQYRAASFFGRLHCPERLMGMQTLEELRDITHDDRPAMIDIKTGREGDAIRAAMEAEGTVAETKTAPTIPTPTVAPSAVAAHQTPAVNASESDTAAKPSPAAPVSGRPRAKSPKAETPASEPQAAAPEQKEAAAPTGDPRTPREQAQEFADTMPIEQLKTFLTDNAPRIARAKVVSKLTGPWEEFDEKATRTLAMYVKLAILEGK